MCMFTHIRTYTFGPESIIAGRNTAARRAIWSLGGVNITEPGINSMRGEMQGPIRV